MQCKEITFFTSSTVIARAIAQLNKSFAHKVSEFARSSLSMKQFINLCINNVVAI